MGELSLLLPEKRVARFSVLDFWGNRQVGGRRPMLLGQQTGGGPYALDPGSYALDPGPYALNPEPYALDPGPCTLDPGP